MTIGSSSHHHHHHGHNLDQSISDALSYQQFTATSEESHDVPFDSTSIQDGSETEDLRSIPLLSPNNSHDEESNNDQEIGVSHEENASVLDGASSIMSGSYFEGGTCKSGCVSCASTWLPWAIRVLATNGAFFLGTFCCFLAAAFEYRSAFYHRNDGDDVSYDDDLPFANEWIYDYIVFDWDFLKFMNVLGTSFFLLGTLSEVCYKDQDNCWDWGVLIFFGSAATLDLLSSLCVDNLDLESYIFGNLSTDMFLMSAILEVVSHRSYYWWACADNFSLLILLADIFFLSGTSLDAIVARLDGPNNPNHKWVWMSMWSLISAGCWVTNAILGVVSEWIYDEDDDETSQGSDESYEDSFISVLDDGPSSPLLVDTAEEGEGSLDEQR